MFSALQKIMLGLKKTLIFKYRALRKGGKFSLRMVFVVCKLILFVYFISLVLLYPRILNEQSFLSSGNQDSLGILGDAKSYPPYKNGIFPNPLLARSINSEITAKEFLEVIDHRYAEFIQETGFQAKNNKIERLFKLGLSFDIISRLRFEREVKRFEKQKENETLYHAWANTKWYREYLLLVTDDPDYYYSESRAVRILLSLHTAAHFYQISYPLFFCLIFQESKFDFKIRSHTGARGLGQLTSIGISQAKNLYRKSVEKHRIQQAAHHLNLLYHDPVIREVLQALGFSLDLPVLEEFPKDIIFSEINSSFFREVARELLKKGHKIGKNLRLVKQLSRRVSRGDILPNQYAPVHEAYSRVVERKYENRFGNILNIETNIFLSAMLLNYYINYRWTVNEEELPVEPLLRDILGIAAYNKGQREVLRFLRQVQRDFPSMELQQFTLEDFQKSFTRKRLAKTIRYRPYSKSKEVFSHVKETTSCSLDHPLFL